MDKIEYIAGFFDGDGSIGVYHRGQGGYHLRTQLTQNKTIESTILFMSLRKRFGGNISEQISLSGNVKYNWQLNSIKAVIFLEDIVPYLRLKKTQAYIAIEWQKQRPIPFRDELGRIQAKTNECNSFDYNVSCLLKLLKHQDIDEVMANQADLVKIVKRLTPLAAIKG